MEAEGVDEEDDDGEVKDDEKRVEEAATLEEEDETVVEADVRGEEDDTVEDEKAYGLEEETEGQLAGKEGKAPMREEGTGGGWNVGKGRKAPGVMAVNGKGGVADIVADGG